MRRAREEAVTVRAKNRTRSNLTRPKTPGGYSSSSTASSFGSPLSRTASTPTLLRPPSRELFYGLPTDLAEVALPK